MALPDKFIKNMQNIFSTKTELDKFIASFEANNYKGIRANNLKINNIELEKIFKGNLQPITWASSGYYYNGKTPASKHPLYAAGLYYIQEPSAMCPVEVLDVQPHDKVLDLCASPGGKSTQIATKLSCSGLLVSNDLTVSRLPQLVKNIEKFGIKNAIITNETAQNLAKNLPHFFDKILVDAPCSGEGMFRKDKDAIVAWDKEKPARLCKIQAELLTCAAKMLNIGGKIVYSTCTFNITENEEVIDIFLKNNPNFDIISLNNKEYGISKADEMLDISNLQENISNALRIWPHKQKGEGHFIALLQKKFDNHPKNSVVESRKEISKVNYKHYYEFCNKYLKKIPTEIPIIKGERLYALPKAKMPMQGLKIIRPGLFLGSLKSHSFKPSYALAMSLTNDNFRQNIDLPLNHDDIRRFLNGEAFYIKGNEGYNLFCIEGYSIGFAKVQGQRLKDRAL